MKKFFSTLSRRDLLNDTIILLKMFGVRPFKRFSQNFIVDPDAIKIFLENISENDIVLEIGAGLGTLTKFIASKAKKIIAVEVDYRLIPILNLVLEEYDNVEIINMDFLELKPFRIDKIVSNIPYNISSIILEKIVKEYEFNKALLGLQKEFGLRMMAKPGSENYSRLTVLTQFYCKIDVLKILSRRSFYPEPEVDSIILSLTPDKKYRLNVSEDFFFKIVSILFMFRRKVLKKVLKHYLSKHIKLLSHDKLIEEIDFKILRKRIYMLSIPELIDISEKIWRYYCSNR